MIEPNARNRRENFAIMRGFFSKLIFRSAAESLCASPCFAVLKLDGIGHLVFFQAQMILTMDIFS